MLPQPLRTLRATLNTLRHIQNNASHRRITSILFTFTHIHSGTVMDLPYSISYDQKSGAAYWKGSRMYGTAGGTAFQLGACE